MIAALSLTLVGLLACGVTVVNATVMTGSYASCKVVEKDDSAAIKGKSDLLIHAEGCNGGSETFVFAVDGSHAVGFPEHALTFHDIEVGNLYEFETRGFQIPFLHSHETVIKISATPAEIS
jgi:hypothetical protein